FGRSKYGPWRFITGVLDILLVALMADARARPRKALGLVGLAFAGVGAAALAYLGVLWLLQFKDPATYKPLTERPLLFYALGALVVGAQMTTLAIIAGLLPAARREAQFSVRERRSFE